MNVRYGPVSGMLMKLNYPIRAMVEYNHDKHCVVIVPKKNSLSLNWYIPNWGVRSEPMFQFFTIENIHKTIIYPRMESATLDLRTYTVAKGTALLQLPTENSEQRRHVPTWYVRDDTFIHLLRIPYKDVPPGLTKSYEEYPILADWLEEMRDEDTDYRRKQHATYLVESLRGFINESREQEI